MEHREVGVSALLPAHEDAAEAMQPGVGALDHPAAGAEAGFALERLGLLAARADMRGEAELVEQFSHLVVVVASVEAERLRRGTRRAGPGDRDRVDRRARQLEVVAVGARRVDRERDAFPLGEE